MPNLQDERPKPQLVPMTPIELQMHEDLRWAMEHHNELEDKYLGETIIVFKKQVVAHGTDEGKLLEQATSPERPREQLVVVEFPGYDF